MRITYYVWYNGEIIAKRQRLVDALDFIQEHNYNDEEKKHLQLTNNFGESFDPFSGATLDQ